jgi:hypothetical protein
VSITIVCWNILGFSYNKVNHSTIGPDIARVFEDADAGFILEASASELAAQSAAESLAGSAALREGDAVNCGGLGGEEECVAYVRRAGVTVTNVRRLTGTWDGSIRSPVVADVEKTGTKVRVAVWHAPPPGKDDLRAAAWPRVLTAASMAKVDFILGDFNAPLVAGRRSDYEVIVDATGTTLSNPNLVRAYSLADIRTGEAYDRVYKRRDTRRTVVIAGIYISKLPDLAIPPRGAVTTAERKDPRRAYAMSNHLPVILRVR